MWNMHYRQLLAIADFKSTACIVTGNSQHILCIFGGNVDETDIEIMTQALNQIILTDKVVLLSFVVPVFQFLPYSYS